MISICVVRHAIAVERGTSGYIDDGLRPLTPEGREKMTHAAAGLRQLFVARAVLTSPLVRARQTADILLPAWDTPALQVSRALATGDHDELLRDVAAAGVDDVAVVGHEPHLSSFISYCLAGDDGAIAVTMKKGAAALLSFDGPPVPGRAWLEWLLQPAALRQLARR